MIQASRISIENSDGESCDDMNRAAPVINGNNFFTGDYALYAEEFMSLSNTTDPKQWNNFWRETLEQEPPGPLPDGATAIFLASYNPKDPIAIEPERLRLDADGLHVDWKRLHLTGPGQAPGASRYAVIILPRYGFQSTRQVSFEEEQERLRTEEKKKWRAEATIIAEAFRKGAEEKVALLPMVKLKPKNASPGQQLAAILSR